MANVELQINCLCLFVPDPANEVVHILMPGTNGHAAKPEAGEEPEGGKEHKEGEGHEDHRHVVRILHPSFEGEEKDVGRGMEGWALTLGPEDASADPSLLPPTGLGSGGELPNLSRITGRKVDRELVGLNPGNRVAARITLRSGRVADLVSEATWEIKGQTFALAHQVTWRMSDVDHVLHWEGLNGKANTDPKPLETLLKLKPEGNLGYKLQVFHVTKEALPVKGGTLEPHVMRAHFRAFYPLLGENTPGDALLPRIKDPGIGRVNCGSSRAALG